ncbi:hypothetical protein SSBR45G_60850 [Bradyrhizobium sp. SSBR45G]|uniref:hypothetical protein n=1 Tax=unclassified Bradyrhizobium TaxID=2631580 RepID=UPI0023429E91|nr:MULTISPECIES: hypothetical protein [unclassified Bradyrhizobium]GLH81176.1 hypothetical protein SSBR45G_60850 [Bradyrhizobium sp. SSBR45G]GLH88577.1 hypothetical protein SSBR45R_60380 [Bradyrhizobium sp. SSBR45R]
MARVLTAYLKRNDVPTRTALQHAITRLPFALTLDDGYVPLESSGYLPCTLDGEDAGFDLRFTDVAEQRADACDVAMTLKWGGDPREEAAALAVCAALATNFGAIVQRDGKQLSPDHMLEQAKGALV